MKKTLFFVLSLVLLMSFGLIPAFGSAPKEAEEEGPIKLGALYNLTGGMSSIDAPALNGAKLKAKLINEAGGLLGGRMVDVVGIDP